MEPLFPGTAGSQSEEMSDELRVGRRLELDALSLKVFAEDAIVDEVAVMGEGDGPTGGGIADQDGLGIADDGAAGGAVASVAYSDVAAQERQIFLVENLGNETHARAYGEVLAIGGGDASALLSAMLEGIQPEKGEASYIFAWRIDAEDATGLSRFVGRWTHARRGLPLVAWFQYTRKAVSPAPAKVSERACTVLAEQGNCRTHTKLGKSPSKQRSSLDDKRNEHERRGPDEEAAGVSIPRGRTSAVALAGLTLVLAALGAFTVWMSVRVHRTVTEAVYARTITARLEKVSDATDEAERAGTEFLLVPNEATLQKFEGSLAAVEEAYAAALADARPEDRSRIEPLEMAQRSFSERYRQSARAFVRGEQISVTIPTLAETAAVVESFRTLLEEFRTRSETTMQTLDSFQRRATAASAALSVFAVTAAIGLGLLTRTYSRREGRTAAELEQLQILASTDPLTRLGNSRAFQRALREYMEHQPSACAVAILDVDHLREVNEVHGPAAGDMTLTAVASVLRATVHQEHQIFRIGADEFAVLMPGLSYDGAYYLCQRLRERCDEELDGTSVSIGLSTAELADGDPAMLQEQATAALQEAKRRGRNMVVGYDPGMFASLTSAGKAGELRRLLNEGRITAVFQPIWEMGTGRLLAFEGLSRLPTSGTTLRGPQEAFDLAERIGRAHDLDMHCRHAIIKAAQGLPPDVLLFVNVSPYTLSHQLPCACLADRGPFVSWAQAFAEEFRANGIDPRQVVLEVTERSSVSVDIVAASVRELRAAGFKVALDDVGSGNAGLEMLRRLPVDYVKVDRGVLLSAMESQTGRAALVAIIAFAAVTGAKVIAEGIENEAMLELVRQGGLRSGEHELLVHAVQGYLFGRPGQLRLDERANPLAKAA